MIAKLLFYVKLTSSIKMLDIETFLNRTIRGDNGQYILGGQYEIKSISVFGMDQFIFDERISMGF